MYYVMAWNSRDDQERFVGPYQTFESAESAMLMIEANTQYAAKVIVPTTFDEFLRKCGVVREFPVTLPNSQRVGP